MPEDPFSPLLDGLGELLKMMEASAKKDLSGPVDPAIEKQLEFFEKVVDRFEEIANEEIQREGKDVKGVYDRLEKTPQIYTETEKKLLRRCRDLGVNAAILRMGIAGALKKSLAPKERQIGKNTKKSIQKRRGKFKGMDGGSTWKRL